MSKSDRLSNYLKSEKAQEHFRAEIERQEALPSRAFPPTAESGSKPRTLAELFQDPEAKERLMQQIKEQNEAPSKAFPTTE